MIKAAGGTAIGVRIDRTGQLCSSWKLAREYRFNDADGRRPAWGALVLFARNSCAGDGYARSVRRSRQGMTRRRGVSFPPGVSTRQPTVLAEAC